MSNELIVSKSMTHLQVNEHLIKTDFQLTFLFTWVKKFCNSFDKDLIKFLKF